jgi:hypothetical protein
MEYKLILESFYPYSKFQTYYVKDIKAAYCITKDLIKTHGNSTIKLCPFAEFSTVMIPTKESPVLVYFDFDTRIYLHLNQ